MFSSQPAPIEFLTVEEVTEVDRALLTTQDKFVTRVALYSLRTLKKITESTGQSVESVTPEQIEDWIAQDDAIQEAVDSDGSFLTFFSRIMLSSLKPLRQIAAEAGTAIESLTVPQVVQWFEKEAKLRMSQGNNPA
ncbi:hypothetical protein [Leptolyngbya sp. FACHB-711]|uniref:hypothetical protein n=1 Tax=unclassified Leptolyngbya TaxID=2650499 RepID=UPI0016823D83|nr:hypothetical protein [Leptolyngbya sp. FACHB-711]MBD1851630.1 hypothetical protein [Cyanobacteria bacterium FACHB-502]MBD2026336.1 hypothetical protein [Leptolyngbya sp. FACHB-711]